MKCYFQCTCVHEISSWCIHQITVQFKAKSCLHHKQKSLNKDQYLDTAGSQECRQEETPVAHQALSQSRWDQRQGQRRGCGSVCPVTDPSGTPSNGPLNLIKYGQSSFTPPAVQQMISEYLLCGRLWVQMPARHAWSVSGAYGLVWERDLCRRNVH